MERLMKEAAEKQKYEEAAELRDKMIAIENISQKQKVTNFSNNDIDVIGIAKNDLSVCVEVFFVRGSRMIGREHFFLNELKDMTNSEIISGFIKEYYVGNQNIPGKIMIEEEIEDEEVLSHILSEEAGKKVEIKSPKKGEKLRFVEMAKNNAKVTLENNTAYKYEILSELKEILNLDKFPNKIETFDISNISGTNIVAGMSVLQDGKINKTLSRRFKIKTVFGQDDPRCMEEVIERRIKRSLESDNSGFGKLPDIIFVDGGITQIRAALEATKKCGVEIPIYGMVKNDKHRTRALIDPERREIPLSENAMNLITRFQDTVHDTAISYHRKLRDKEMTKSKLDDISGIGEKKKEALLKKFGSVEKIKKANIDEIQEVKGINEDLARKIKKELE